MRLRHWHIYDSRRMSPDMPDWIIVGPKGFTIGGRGAFPRPNWEQGQLR